MILLLLIIILAYFLYLKYTERRISKMLDVDIEFSDDILNNEEKGNHRCKD